ncbi:hypothetical protein [Rhodococcus opacus]|uniref:hypothetical protein n=1 Tax=Rhodococcus opacus TaxID=37919 RepID=UPI001300BD3B|nr:hypothetical protein [Rhodococcus opacus]
MRATAAQIAASRFDPADRYAPRIRSMVGLAFKRIPVCDRELLDAAKIIARRTGLRDINNQTVESNARRRKSSHTENNDRRLEGSAVSIECAGCWPAEPAQHRIEPTAVS